MLTTKSDDFERHYMTIKQQPEWWNKTVRVKEYSKFHQWQCSILEFPQERGSKKIVEA